MTKLTLNGKPTEFKVPSDTPLLWVLRDVANMTGTKYGCGAGLCGACTVHIDGQAVRSCQTPIGDIEGASVVTIEGLSPGRSHPVQKAWIELQVPQCGYCQSGMIMAAAALINEIPAITEQDVIENITNLCRCGTYPRIKKAIVRAGVLDAAENPGRRKTQPPKTDIPTGMPLEEMVPEQTR
jgi:isoquinoline 1-oxidoreductase subunit alpha